MYLHFSQRAVNVALTASLVVLQACSTPKGSSGASPVGYLPDVNLKGEARRQYEQDVIACQKQNARPSAEPPSSNNAIIQLRQCLIQKGYVLLS